MYLYYYVLDSQLFSVFLCVRNLKGGFVAYIGQKGKYRATCKIALTECESQTTITAGAKAPIISRHLRHD